MDDKLFKILQFAGGTFPTGGFSHSYALETYVEEGIVENAFDLKSFIDTYLDHIIARCEGPILLEAHKESRDMDKLLELDSLSNATKLTAESRNASRKMGRALIRIVTNIYEEEFSDVDAKFSYPVAYGLVFSRLGISAGDTLRSFVFGGINTITQSGVKLIPLGNTEAQDVISKSGEAAEKCVRRSLELGIGSISTFCPGLDIAGMKHEILKTRLYMS